MSFPSGRPAYITPEFDPSDPLVCHSIALRPSLWTVVWFVLQELGSDYSWRQLDPTHATPSEVAGEIEKATDSAIFAGCMMIGQVFYVALETVPDYCLICDGSTYENADYPDLAAAIHINYHVDASHFRVPNLVGRFALGAFFPSAQGGAAEHTLTIEEIPAHAHDYDQIAATLIGDNPPPAIIGIDDINTVATGSTGGGQPHNNMPPYEEIIPVIIARYPTAG